jgi:hypothetical protein
MTATATPIADVPGATTGWVRGRLIGDAPIIAPLSGRPCWYYKIVVEQVGAIVGDDGGRRLAYEARGQSFEIDDGTGVALIDPEGAQVEVDYDHAVEVMPGARLVQPLAELVRRFKLPAAPVVLREGVLEVGEVVAAHGRLIREVDPDPARQGPRVRVVGVGRERVFVSERSVDGWSPA